MSAIRAYRLDDEPLAVVRLRRVSGNLDYSTGIAARQAGRPVLLDWPVLAFDPDAVRLEVPV